MALNYPESVAVLKERVEIIGDALPHVTQVPRPADDPIGPSIFRMRLEDADISGLSLPGLYVGRSVLTRVSFKASELRLSAFNWNGLHDCNFSAADLERADLRSSRFVRCSFDGAILEGADLRGSSFERCSFVAARFQGTLLQKRGLLGWLGVDRGQEGLPLSAEQRAVVHWAADAPEAPGG
jgi:uncharacterized protein YjbI with pentapeptide repeats